MLCLTYASVSMSSVGLAEYICFNNFINTHGITQREGDSSALPLVGLPR